MKEGNINQYIADFSLLAMDAQVDPNKPTDTPSRWLTILSMT
jgi:hypothetical protein